MARPRRKKLSAAYERRNKRARELGFRNYYEQRTAGTKRGSAARAKARGHRSRSDFLSSLSEGDLIIIPSGLSSVERRPDGRYVLITKLVIDGDTGEERTYTLRNLTRAQLVATIADEEASGAVFSPSPSLDQRRLVTEEEAEGGY